jgi:hypothetical protein
MRCAPRSTALVCGLGGYQALRSAIGAPFLRPSSQSQWSMARVARFIDTMRWQRAVLGDEDLLPVMRADLLRRVGCQDTAKKLTWVVFWRKGGDTAANKWSRHAPHSVLSCRVSTKRCMPPQLTCASRLTKQKLATFAVHYVNTLRMGLARYGEAQGNGTIVTSGSRAR